MATIKESLVTLANWRTTSGVEVLFVRGSITDFVGDAIVNAANEGCTGGFGVDEVVNRAAGHQLKEARKLLNGCPTGMAKVTPSFEHTKVKWIIHAVGPVYRVNPLNQHAPKTEDEIRESFAVKDKLLASAYQESMARAKELGVQRIGFTLLSTGVFRGIRDIYELLALGVQAVVNSCYPGLKQVVFVAYTEEEQVALTRVYKEFIVKV